jgi:cobalt-zinc-cadmium efflux system membrane fusion protein
VRLLLLAVSLCLGTSCSSNPPASTSTESNKRAGSEGTSEVVIDEAAQRKIGLVVQAVAPQVVHEVITSTGHIAYNEDQSWSVGSVTDGRVVSISAKVGDRVAVGQVLARIHSHDVHDSRAEYQKGADEVVRVRAALAQAERVRDRARRLFELKAMSKEQLEQAEMDQRNAQAAVDKAVADLEKRRAHLVEFLDVPAQDTAGPGANHEDFIPIKSPGSGVVVERHASTGSAITAGQQLFRIANLSALWMIANVNEADLAHLRPGQTVRVSVRAYPDRKFIGRVLRLGEQLDPATRTLQVRVLVPNEHGLLKPEMFANAEIDRAAERERIVIPEAAIQDLNGHKIVFLQVAPTRFAVRALETTPAGAGQVAVVAGLKANDAVVVKGGFILKSQLLRSSLEEE